MAGPVSFVLLAAVVVLVTLRPSGRAEVTVALPAALIVVVARLAPWSAARHELRFLAPTLLFLGAVFVIAEVAAAAGVFDAAGRVIGRLAGDSPLRLVLVVAAAATVTTTVLSLDTTAVLLTPVVIRVARNRRVEASPSLLATAQLANGGSLLLPVSNLTNLIVFPLTGLTFAGFALRMALPLVAATTVITAVLATRVRTAAAVGSVRSGSTETPVINEFSELSDTRLDRFGRGVSLALVALLAAFFLGSLAHIAPSAIAAAGAGVLAIAALARKRTTPTTLVRAASPGFLVFVAALGVVVAAATRTRPRPGRRTRAARGHGVRFAAGDRVRRGGARQRGEQPARHTRVADGTPRGRGRAVARRAHRRERRPQPHLYRLTRHVAVA